MSAQNVTRQTLSDLEFLVLGVIWRDGPCTAYRIRQEFAESPNSHWSGSQGSIYPLLRKLENHQLIGSKASSGDQRKTRLVTITPAGKRQLISWYDVSRPRSVLLQENDAIRTRLFFINVLPVAKRKKYFDYMMVLLRQQQDELVAEIENCGSDQLQYRIAWEGVLAINEARQKWLSKTRRLLNL